MIVESVSNSAAADQTNRSEARSKPTSPEKPWTVEDIIDISDAAYVVALRPEAENLRYMYRLANYLEDGKAVILEKIERSAEEIARHLPGTLGVSGTAEKGEASGLAHRELLNDFATAHKDDFEDFVRQGIGAGVDKGTDWEDSFFLAQASQQQIADYQVMKAGGDQWKIINDQRGRYLAQHGVDLAKPFGLTQLDDGTYAEVSGHPQKHYIEHLVNSAPDLWGSAWNDYHATPGR